jgi:acyl-CoA synthetase (AMP-forming)/AMP-acid ligase II
MGEVGVAIVVPRPGGPMPEVTQLRTFASDRLARYKLPDDVVVLHELPLTAGDKVDRRALERLIAPL